MITTESGYKAAINAASPLEIYCTPIVASPLAATKSSTDMPAIHFNCCREGSFSPFTRKKPANKVPAMNCRMAATSNAGTCCTAILLAIQLVPQTMLVTAKAIYDFCLVVKGD